MRYLTSLNPKDRITHQQTCVQTWFDSGATDVCAVQTASDDMDLLRSCFPSVRFEVTDKTGVLFDRPYLPTIRGIVDFADFSAGGVLLINSDIEVRLSKDLIQKEFVAPSDVVRCFIRWDYNQRKASRPIKWGIDAFMLTESIAGVLPEDGMTIGCPVWDWWLPWLSCRLLDARVSAWTSKGFMHAIHPQNWPMEQMQVGFTVMQDKYNIQQRELARWILQQTKRAAYSSIALRP